MPTILEGDEFDSAKSSGPFAYREHMRILFQYLERVDPHPKP